MKMTSFQRPNVALGAFSFMTSYSNFNVLSSLHSGDQRGLQQPRFFGMNFTVGNGRDFKNT